MKQTPGAAITSIPASPTEERHVRMVKYAVAMGIRLVCIAACFVTPGWWLLIPALGAIILPSFAVLVANNVVPSSGPAVERPGQMMPYSPGGPGQSA
ncbi:DUF3099 domain-containing protein [Microcella daejeonensis]|jgi:Protein of unknown function (DUF3099)|uniref:DUF3099 domain-containing protein n=1 Tax=Microcella daejeonensis TaxID=2994971 RepID=A0A9E8S8U5_9MICO|nr:DUF3099 domain-containing protein [Microcella daejeonensis]WAB81259.1 DUF3099 domain-containing protein [Microcella daejeonensis]